MQKALFCSVFVCVILLSIMAGAQSATYGLSGSSGTPTFGACGTTPSLSAGSMDFGGQITMGSGIVTSCALNFSSAFTSPPKCVISSNSVAVTVGLLSIATGGIVIGTSAALPGGVVNYLCIVN